MNVAETNGHAQPKEEHRASVLADFAGVLEDHVNLAALEAQFEVQQVRRRFLFISISAMLGLSAFLLGQVAIVDGLVALLKIPVWAVCLLLTAFYATVAAIIFNRYTRRDPRAGAPFSGTRHEIIETLQWIQKLFS